MGAGVRIGREEVPEAGGQRGVGEDCVDRVEGQGGFVAREGEKVAKLGVGKVREVGVSGM